ncbi:DEAD/DEAH box helicase [Mycoplasma todarodis]|uniref:AAA+ ATPase domain-containing protein n=1 Tax=Mycoplasma todarodis TaxID=1937191 RepID=A0A4R0XMA5_9MOLU|nr:AAA domain-containing protein [Mycoplasma todarodis]TCG11840.1 hypothetical protein C4B25_00785 [Mycoplasma todarodis]
MRIYLKEIILNKKFTKKIKPEMKELIEKFNANPTGNAMLASNIGLVAKKSGDNEELNEGVNNVVITFKINKKFLTLIGNLIYSPETKTGTLLAFIGHINEMESFDGIEVEINREEATAEQYSFNIKQIMDQSDKINADLSDHNIVKALSVYSEILSREEEATSMDIPTDKIRLINGYLVDNSISKERDKRKLSFIRHLGRRRYVEQKDVKHVDRQYLSHEITIMHIEVTGVKNVGVTIKDVIKSKGQLPMSDRKKFIATGDYSGVSPLDYSIAESITRRPSFKIMIDGKHTSLNKSHLHIINVASTIKNRTILKVVTDIENDTVSNNEVFQYLFNKGSWNAIKPLPKWIPDFKAKQFAKSTNLNESQRKAFKICSDNTPVAFVQGPPGTGKTHLIEKLVDFYASNKKKVLIASQTNVAVENVLDKLHKDKEFPYLPIKIEYRNKSLYSEEQIGEQIGKKIENITGWNLEGMEIPNIKEIHAPRDFRVVGSTTTSSAIENKRWKEWLKQLDVLIIDEISKSNVPEIIRFTTMAKKVIFIGDQKQLDPMSEINWSTFDKDFKKDNEDIISKYISLSIFENKYEDMRKRKRAVMLNINYRSVEPIARQYAMFYNNKLEIGRQTETVIKYKGEPAFKPFTFISASGSKEEFTGPSNSRFNIREIDIINDTLEKLLSTLDDPKKYSVAVITTYGAQTEQIQKSINTHMMREYFQSFKVNTVDAFQGDQADIVILSTVVADNSGSKGFISDFRRLNVSISRARDLLIVIGSENKLSSIMYEVPECEPRAYLAEMIEYAKENDSFIKPEVNHD